MIDLNPNMHRGELIREISTALRHIALDDYDGRRLSIVEDAEARHFVLYECEHKLMNSNIDARAKRGLLNVVSYILLNGSEQRKYLQYAEKRRKATE